MDRILPLASPPPPARLFFLPDAAHAWREEVDGTTASLGSNTYPTPILGNRSKKSRRPTRGKAPSVRSGAAQKEARVALASTGATRMAQAAQFGRPDLLVGG